MSIEKIYAEFEREKIINHGIMIYLSEAIHLYFLLKKVNAPQKFINDQLEICNHWVKYYCGLSSTIEVYDDFIRVRGANKINLDLR